MWRWGCVITSLCVLLSSRGSKITPAQMAKMPGLFNAEGEILWGELSRATKGAVREFNSRLRTRDDKAIRATVLGGPTLVALIEVEVKNDRHFVAALAVSEDKKDFWIEDPLDGKRKWLSKCYPNIKGSAHLTLA